MPELPWNNVKEGIQRFREIELWNGVNIQGLHFIISPLHRQECREDNSFTKALRNTLMMRVSVSLVGSVVASLSRLYIRMGNNSLISKEMTRSKRNKG